MDTDIIYQGARGAVVAFFLYGAKTLAPPPPVDSSRAMLAAFLVMVALALWVTVEQLVAAKLLGATGNENRKTPPRSRRRNGRKPGRHNSPRGNIFNLVPAVLSALGSR